MTVQYKVLGQSNPSATTNTDLYSVPSGRSAVCSSITICNQSTATTFRIAIRPAGATISAAQYLAYNIALAANETITMSIGITLDATDVVTVYSGSSSLSFNIFGSEIY